MLLLVVVLSTMCTTKYILVGVEEGHPGTDTEIMQSPPELPPPKPRIAGEIPTYKS